MMKKTENVGDENRTDYIRIGNESVPADAAALKRLVLRGMNVSYDSILSPYRIDDFSFSKLKSVYRMRTGTELTPSDFISFELADENRMLTNAGVLLADDSPMRHSRLFCTHWYGLDKASGIMEALDDKEYSGSLVSLLQNGMEFVKNNTKKRWKKTGTGRLEMPDYPEQAVLEALVNGLIHRDYMELGSEVHIDIFDDRMEIYSPGGMLDGSLVQNLDTDSVASKRRNPVIADIFSRMHFMERRGSGFRKIKEDYRHASNYRPGMEPLFRSTPSSFFVILHNLNYNVPIEGVSIDSPKVTIAPDEVSIDSPKVTIAPEKVSIAPTGISMETAIADVNFTKSMKEKATSLFTQMGFHGIFGRNDIRKITGLSATSAGSMIARLRQAELIEAVSGHGKGKYKFIQVGS